MNIFLIISIIAVIVVFELGKELFRWFFKKKNDRYFRAGFNQAVSHIYSQIKKTGKIDLILDGNKTTLVALPAQVIPKDKKNGSNNL